LFESGRLVDLILVMVLIEVFLLAWWLPRSGSTLRVLELLPNLAAGAALLVALRFALAGADWRLLALALSAALVAHITDLVLRWARGRNAAQ
jgi:hypothetical protein